MYMFTKEEIPSLVRSVPTELKMGVGDGVTWLPFFTSTSKGLVKWHEDGEVSGPCPTPEVNVGEVFEDPSGSGTVSLVVYGSFIPGSIRPRNRSISMI